MRDTSRTGLRPSLTGIGVKICGLTRRSDAELAREEGADFLGVVLVPGTPRALTPSRARALVEGLEVPVVAVMADVPPARAAEDAHTVGAGVIQLHGAESREDAARLREAGPWAVWKALRVQGVEDVLSGLREFSGTVDGILLDGWHPVLRGGSGRVFSWGEVESVREMVPETLRLIAAGGLHPGNVTEAVRRLKPHVVDVSSGVEERPGIKDPVKVRTFIRNARAAAEVLP